MVPARCLFLKFFLCASDPLFVFFSMKNGRRRRNEIDLKIKCLHMPTLVPAPRLAAAPRLLAARRRHLGSPRESGALAHRGTSARRTSPRRRRPGHLHLPRLGGASTLLPPSLHLRLPPPPLPSPAQELYMKPRENDAAAGCHLLRYCHHFEQPAVITEPAPQAPPPPSDP